MQLHLVNITAKKILSWRALARICDPTSKETLLPISSIPFKFLQRNCLFLYRCMEASLITSKIQWKMYFLGD